MQHRARPWLSKNTPVHVSVHVIAGLPSLRRDEECLTLMGVFEKCCERDGFRLVHYSVQHSHLHLLVEARDRQSFTQGMRALLIRMSRALNRLWNRRGQVVAERYHEHVLRVPKEARNVLAYVLNNARRHGIRVEKGRPDTRSSGRFFEGWRDFAAVHIPGLSLPIAQARSWLLTVGWLRHGRIPVDLVPGDD